MSLRRTPAFLFVSFFALSTASPSAAQYSMAGKWGFEPNGGAPNLDLVQSGGTLSWNGGSTVGTIDESTGEFHLDFGILTYPACGRHLLDGFVALDSLTFIGTHSYGVVTGPTPHLLRCAYDAHAIQGSRCGNGMMDSGEACDDDNGRDGDCCSSTCQYDAPGAACTSDQNQCTDDTCDGSGICLYTNNSGPCSEGCMDGTCSAGDCVLGAPSPSGAPCTDNDYCTVDDACDGAGECAPGGPFDCGPCGVCDWSGCRSPVECENSENPAGPAKLAMSIEEDSGEDRFSLRLKDIVPAEELGNPATTTNYRLCVAARDDSFLAVPRPLLAFELPVGGLCGTRECWKASASGFKYKDSASTSDGISTFVAGTRGFKAKGRGALLPFGAELPTEELLVQVLSDDGGTTRCREARLTSSISSTTEYRGAFKP
jgi:hypothetical protein